MDGGVDGRVYVIDGFRLDFRVMLIVFVVVVAFSAPGIGGGAADRSFCVLGGGGCCGVASLGRVYYCQSD